MQTSAEGRRRLIAREGLRLEAYKDSVGVWTCGVGHTAAAGAPVPFPGMKITKEEAEDILSRDLLKYERAIDNALKVPVAQHEYDALVSICFNVGPKFAESTCIKLLNKGDRKGAADAMMWWNKPPEIVGRRQSEQRQFKTPYKAATGAVSPKPAPIPPIKTDSPAKPVSWLESLLNRIIRKA